MAEAAQAQTRQLAQGHYRKLSPLFPCFCREVFVRISSNVYAFSAGSRMISATKPAMLANHCGCWPISERKL